MGAAIKIIATFVAALAFACGAHAHANDSLVDTLVDRLEGNLSSCASVDGTNAQRAVIEADIAQFIQAVPAAATARFEVHDCPLMDGFVLKGQTIVLSSRLARLPYGQRFFIMAHEYGHYRLQHRNRLSGFVSSVTAGRGDPHAAQAALDQNAAGVTAMSYRAEFEADAFAVLTMDAAGVDPEDGARLFDSLGRGRDNSTHPAFHRRASAIRTLHARLKQTEPQAAPAAAAAASMPEDGR